MKFKKLLFIFILLIFLTACKKEESHEIKFSTGEAYKFETLSVEVVSDEENMKTREIFSSEDNEEKLKEIISLLYVRLRKRYKHKKISLFFIWKSWKIWWGLSFIWWWFNFRDKVYSGQIKKSR